MNDRDIQRSITAFWDTVAPAYDSPENVAAAGSADYDRWRQALAQILPSAPARVLDVGTGTGFVAGIAAQLGHRVTAIDLSAGMLDAARAADSAAGVTFVVGDAVAPAFPPASFDAVISRSVLWTLREPNRAIANWSAAGTTGQDHRVLRTRAGQGPRAGERRRAAQPVRTSHQRRDAVRAARHAPVFA